MTTNPERLWAFAKTYGGEDYVGIFAETEESVAEGERASHEDDEHCAPVTAYVREDVAAQHEAAIEAARREERERVLQELRGTLVQCCLDFADGAAHAGGLAHAVRCLEDLITAKGRAE